MELFRCRMCDTEKEVIEFTKDKSRKRGHHPYCRPCQNKVKYRNKSAVIERAVKWNKENKDLRNKRARERSAIKAGRPTEDWIKENKELYEKTKKEQEIKRKEERKKYFKEWRKNNKHLVKQWATKRRSKIKNVSDGSLTKEVIDGMEKICYLCEKDLRNEEDFNIHLEHKTPISRGGKHSADNVAWSCASCNLEKGNKTEKEYIEYLKNKKKK